jgi:hypothetical protein
MKTTAKLTGLFFVITLLLAGCGGSSSSNTVGSTQDPPPLDQIDNGEGGTITAVFTSAVDINDANQVVGYAQITDGAPLMAALWTVANDGTPTGTPIALKGLAVGEFNAAFAIDETGTSGSEVVLGNIVGQSSTGNGIQQVAVIWEAGASEPTELPRLNQNSARNSAAFGISPDGTMIVGMHEKNIGTNLNPIIVERPVLWQRDAQTVSGYSIIELPFAIDADAVSPNFTSSAYGVGNAVNDAGWIAGELENKNGRLHAVIWVPSLGGGYLAADAIDLRSGGEEGSAAYAINAANEVVGEREGDPGVFEPTLWTHDGGTPGEFKFTSLAADGSAVAINENGIIAGWVGTGALARASVWEGNTTTNLFTTESQAYGMNNVDEPMVVGRNGSIGYVKKAN